MFSYLGKALHGQDFTSMPQMFALLDARMKCPPHWKHLRDIYSFKDTQPAYLSSRRVQGVTAPHHLRIFRGRDGGLNLQAKRWVTTDVWQPAIALCTPEQVAELRSLPVPVQRPEWDPAFRGSALSWLGKLRGLLAAAGRETAGLTHCEQLLKQELPAYLPSSVSLSAKMAQLRELPAPGRPGAVGFPTAAHAAALAAFPGSARWMDPDARLIHIQAAAGTEPADAGFCAAPVQDGMMILYRSHGERASECPIRLGRVLRVVYEAAAPYAVAESWWPRLKPQKYGDRLNMFGTWAPSRSPQVAPSAPAAPAQKKRATGATSPAQIVVNLADVLAWPVALERGQGAQESEGRIPFGALHYLRARHGLDVSHATYTFAKRGKLFFAEVLRLAGEHLRSAQLGE
jgi:hypothetical protein